MTRVRLLDRGAEEMLVYPQVATVNARGETVYVPSDVPVPITVTTAGDRSSIAELPGQISELIIKCTSRDAPVGPWARVVYQGVEFDLVAPPRFSPGVTRASKHVSFTIKSRPKGAKR